MTKIYLMRHGRAQNPDNLFYGQTFELTDQGKRQAELLAQDMKDVGIRPTVSKCSPFMRTQQTCKIVTGTLGIPDAETDGRLTEWDVGPWFNKPLTEFFAATGYDEKPPRVDDPRIEPQSRMADRVISVINETRKEAEGSTALIVSHREPLASAMLKLQGLPWDIVRTLDFPVATVWELTFADDGTLAGARKAFDRHDAA